MNALRNIGVALSFVVLAAHFLRGGHPVLVLLLLAAPLLLLVRETWAVRLLQVLLLLGALEWLRTLVTLASARAEAGEPYLRMVLILAGVAAVAVLSALGLSRRLPTAELPAQETPAAAGGRDESDTPPDP